MTDYPPPTGQPVGYPTAEQYWQQYQPPEEPRPYVPSGAQYQSVPQHQQRRKGTPKWAVALGGAFGGAVVVLAVVLIMGIGGSSATPQTTPGSSSASVKVGPHQILVNGTMQLNSTSITLNDGGCSGTGGYSDISDGTEVIISDDAGATLALTNLTGGTGIVGSCQYSFTATIAAGKHFYGVEVSHRGIVKFTEEQIASAQVSLGDGS